MIAFCKMFTEIDNLILFGNGKKEGKGDWITIKVVLFLAWTWIIVGHIHIVGTLVSN